MNQAPAMGQIKVMDLNPPPPRWVMGQIGARTFDKATNETLDFKTVSSLEGVSYNTQSGAISTNSSGAYKNYFKSVRAMASSTDMSLGEGGCPEGDCDDAKKSVVWKDQDSSSASTGDNSTNTALIKIGAINLSTGIKNEIIESALKGNKVAGFSQYLKLSKGLGTFLGLASASITYNQYRTDQIGTTEFIVETGSSVLSALIPGWGIGWEGGRIITNVVPGYKRVFRPWVRKNIGLSTD